MAFIVEDGTNVADANSYVTVEYADAYLAFKSNDTAWQEQDTVDKQDYLCWATRLLDQRANFEGRPTYRSDTVAQALRWPRTGVLDRDGFLLAPDAIPAPIKAATVEIAWHLFSQQVDPSLLSSMGQGALKRVKADVVEVEYFTNIDTVSPFPLGINHILWPLGSLSISGTSNAVRILKT